MYRPDTSHQPVESATRTLTSLPALSSLSTNLPSWTRRSKSSNQSDESFSAYLQHPSSSSPAIDRVLEGRYATSSGLVNVSSTPTPLTRRIPSLDTIGYAQERSTPFRHQRTPSLREVAALLEFERGSANRQAFQRVPSWHESNHHRDYSPLNRLEFVPPYASETRFPIGESLRSSSASMSDELVADQEGDDSKVTEENDDEEEDDDDNDDAEADTSQESLNSRSDSKKKRRRTDKNEAKILASVFNETAFPDLRTREALANRLGMSLRAVSIWFQNRRQAMKKRATRFGGVDGIRGATVTAFADLKDEDESMVDDNYVISKPLVSHKLRRWISLDEIALSFSGKEEEEDFDDLPKPEKETNVIEAQVLDRLTKPTIENKSCTPILDLVRKRSGKSLSRIASLPSLIAVLKDAAPTKSQNNDEQKENSMKDLRHVLRDLAASRARPVSELKRSVSMTDARHISSIASAITTTKEVDEIDTPQPLDTLSCAPMGQPSLHLMESVVQNAINKEQDGIWQRMQSSSSGLSSESTPESDKENRDTTRHGQGLDEEGYEDEEKTLRRIAQKRAFKQQSKREQSLSKEGLQYMQEADARLALQQKREANSNCTTRKPLTNLPSELLSLRTGKNAVPIVRSKLSRVTSLDFEAGRDRSKAVERPVLFPIRQLQKVKPSIQRVTDENKNTKAFSRSRSSLTHQQMGKKELNLTFSRSLSERTKMNKLTADKENAVLDMINQTSHDSNVSEGSSEEWMENWTNEKKSLSLIKSKSLSEPNPEWWRQTNKRKVSDCENVSQENDGQGEDSNAVQGHDDSGFFGSDEDNGDHSSVSSALLKKRKVMENPPKSNRQPLKSIQTSFTSPTKRGDERDRLAAEVLLAFGSHS